MNRFSKKLMLKRLESMEVYSAAKFKEVTGKEIDPSNGLHQAYGADLMAAFYYTRWNTARDLQIWINEN